MKYRVLFRMSLNRDTSSHVRNSIEKSLGTIRLLKRPGKTATWEAGGLDPTALQTVARVLQTLSDPSKVPGADPRVTLDHVWLYVDQDKGSASPSK